MNRPCNFYTLLGLFLSELHEKKYCGHTCLHAPRSIFNSTAGRVWAGISHEYNAGTF
jgi:hypothetical protein